MVLGLHGVELSTEFLELRLSLLEIHDEQIAANHQLIILANKTGDGKHRRRGASEMGPFALVPTVLGDFLCD